MKVYSNSPTSFLASFFSKDHYNQELVILTGESGVGKTTCCLELVRQARAIGINPEGIISPGVYRAGEKRAIELLVVKSGERRCFAVRRDKGEADKKNSDHPLGWVFDPEAQAWGNQALRDLTGGDLLFVDELGPLEFRYHGGLNEGLTLIDARSYRLSFIVIRPSLLEMAKKRWPWAVVQSAVGCVKSPASWET